MAHDLMRVGCDKKAGEPDMEKERSRWHEVTEMIDDRRLTLGRYLAYWFERTPRRALYYMA
jgi:hypothetical protein